MGLFDPRPKRDPRDFFDRERELRDFIRYIRSSPLTLVLGLRRYGKTSLILTGLESSEMKYIYIDCKALSSNGMLGVDDFISLFIQSLEIFCRRYRSLRTRIYGFLERIRGISIGPLGISVNTRRFNPSSLVDILYYINDLGEKIVFVVDEAQELRRMVRYSFDSLIAFIYDNMDCVNMVLSGSQIGLLYRLLKISDPDAPLYGRVYMEIRLGRLDPVLSREYLYRGYREYDIEPSEDLIDYVIGSVDGVIGWLAYIGYYTVQKRVYSREAVDEVVENAYNIVLGELENFLKIHWMARDRYLALLETIASQKGVTWSQLYRAVESRIGYVPKPTFNRLLKQLVDNGFIEKRNENYWIADPILEKALKHRIIRYRH